MRLKCFLIIILTGVCFCAFAQNKFIHFKHFGVASGLSELNPTCILQDRKGFIWIGTDNGLNRYDGYKFKVFKKDANDTTSINNNYVQDIAEDNAGNIWVATMGGGLNKYDTKTGRFSHYMYNERAPKSLSSNFITKIAIDRAGKIWVATRRDGINLFNVKTGECVHYFHQKNNPKSISSDEITSVYLDSHNAVWIGTAGNGLNLYDRDNNNFVNLRHQAKNQLSISGDNVTAIFEDRKQRLWIGTNSAGLNLYDSSTATFKHFINEPHSNNSMARNSISSIAEDDNGDLWIGAGNGSLSIYNYNMNQFMDSNLRGDFDNDGSFSNAINAILKDRNGNMWLNAFGGGLNLYKRSKSDFALYKSSNKSGNPSGNFVLSLLEDDKHNLWVGTNGGGLNQLDPKTGKFTAFKYNGLYKNSISGDKITDMLEDNEKNLWVATAGHGLSITNLDTHSFKAFRHNPSQPSSISADHITAIAQTPDKNIWIGTFGNGLDLYQRKTNSFIHFRGNSGNPERTGIGRLTMIDYKVKSNSGVGNTLSSDRINTLFADSKGNLWIGTDDAGLSLFDTKKNKFTNFSQKDKTTSLSNNSIHDIYEDRLGNIWICTLDGLNLFDPKTGHFSVYRMKDGLPSDVIQAIQGDNNGNLWVSTNNGVSSYDPVKKTFKNFSTENGLQADEFEQHAACKSHAGVLYFGGINGLNSFSPDQIADEPFDPPLVFTSLMISNREVPVAKGPDDPSPLKQDISENRPVSLLYDQSVISLEYTALDYSSPDKKKYAYILEGFDKNWNYVDSKNIATYTNIPPGKYTLKVKCGNSEGKWSPHILSLTLTIVPPFWMTWWFKSLVVIFVGGCMYGLYLHRVNFFIRQKKILEQEVNDRTAKIRQQSEELRSQAQRVLAQNESLRQIAYIQSHELRRPVASILGFMNIFKGEDYTATKEELEIMEKAVCELDEKVRLSVKFAEEPDILHKVDIS